jgi:hypothetical protein
MRANFITEIGWLEKLLFILLFKIFILPYHHKASFQAKLHPILSLPPCSMCPIFGWWSWSVLLVPNYPLVPILHSRCILEGWKWKNERLWPTIFFAYITGYCKRLTNFNTVDFKNRHLTERHFCGGMEKLLLLTSEPQFEKRPSLNLGHWSIGMWKSSNGTSASFRICRIYSPRPRTAK